MKIYAIIAKETIASQGIFETKEEAFKNFGGQKMIDGLKKWFKTKNVYFTEL